MKNILIALVASCLLFAIPTSAEGNSIGVFRNDSTDSLATRYKAAGQRLASLGFFDEALDSLDRAIELFDQLNDKENYISCNELFANNLTYLGRYEEAVQIGFLIAEYCSSVYGENSSQYYHALANVATYYGYAGDYKQSILFDHFILDNCEDEYVVVCAKEGLALALMHIGDTDAAIRYFFETIDYFKTCAEYLRVANAYHNIGYCYSEMNNLLYAIRYELDAMAVIEHKYGDGGDGDLLLEFNPMYNKFRHMLAVYYAKLQVYDVAISQEENVLSWVKQSQGEHSVDYINSLSSLAYIYNRNGRNDKWEELIIKAYELCKEYHSDNLQLLSEMMERLVAFEDSKHNSDKVAALVAEVTRLKRKNLLYSFSGMTDSDRQNVWDKENYWFENTIPHLALKYNSASLNNELYNSLLFYKGLLLQSAKTIKLFLSKSSNSEITQMFLDIAKSQKLIKYLEENNSKQSVIDSLKTVLATQERVLLGNCPEIETYFESISIDWRQVQEKLSRDEIAIEFFTTQTGVDSFDYYSAIISSSCSSPFVEYICSSSDINKVEPENSISIEFSELIWGSIARKFNKVKKVYFAPAGLLNSYPIEYLSVPNNPRCEKYRLTSTRELTTNNRSDGVFSSAILFGGIDFNSDSSISSVNESLFERSSAFLETIRGGVHFGPLPGTEIEVNSIAKILKKNGVDFTLLTGDKGSESSFSDISGKDIPIIHIATHGFYYTGSRRKNYYRAIGKTDPLVEGTENGLSSMQLSALLFAGGNNTLKSYDLYQESNNGILTAEEASQLSLDNTRLLVLSACQTALGEITNEGVIGIQRGFKMAGVQSMIMSLWEVDDDATCCLMEFFYSDLVKYQDPFIAFNKAINKLKSFKGKRVIQGQTRKVDYSDPSYWAAFVLVDSI